MVTPEPPLELEGQGLVFWGEHIDRALAKMKVGTCPLILFERLCYQISNAEKAQAAVEEHGVVEKRIDGNGNEVTKPTGAVQALQTCESQIVALGRQLRLWGRDAVRDGKYPGNWEPSGPIGTVDSDGSRSKVTSKRA